MQRSNNSRKKPKDRVARVPVVRTTRELRNARVSRRALSSQTRFTQMHRGVHADGASEQEIHAPWYADDDWFALHGSAAALQLVRPDALISGLSAARLLGWPTPPAALKAPLTVTTRRSGSRVVRPGVETRQSDRYNPMPFYGITLNDKSCVLIELASQISAYDLTAVIDAIIGNWNGPPETDLKTLTGVVDDAGRFVGSARLRRALSLARPDVDSPQETRLRLTIVDAGLPEPVVHPPIPADGVVLHPDLAYVAKMIAIEYEGDDHRRDPERWARDIERYEALAALGWTVIRVTRRTSIPKLIARLSSLLSVE